jgi:PAS domain-containing protein
VDDTITGITVLATEVTEHVLAKKQMAASELFNRTILESSPDCLKVLDIEGRIQFMNFNGLCLMEIDDFSTFKNKSWSTLWGSENEALVKASIDKALTGETAQFTALCPTAKGTPKWWDVVVSPVGVAGKPVQQIISVSRDITE